MRRLFVLLVLAVLLALLVLAAPTAALADDGAATRDLVLAVEGEPAGPEPQPRDADDNPARDLVGYEDREVQFTWGAAWILLFAGIAGLVILAGVYQWLVRKPSSERAGRR